MSRDLEKDLKVEDYIFQYLMETPDRWQRLIDKERGLAERRQYDSISEAQPPSPPTWEEMVKGGIETASDIMTGPVPLGAIGSIKGMKPRRLRNLYHGTPTPHGKEQILKEGFTRGGSSELNLPGTSVSRSPLVSSELFAGRDPAKVMGVELTSPPKEVYNLSPAQYASGHVPEGGVYGKPNIYLEDEVFGLRKEGSIPLSPVIKKEMEEEIYKIGEEIPKIKREKNLVEMAYLKARKANKDRINKGISTPTHPSPRELAKKWDKLKQKETSLIEKRIALRNEVESGRKSLPHTLPPYKARPLSPKEQKRVEVAQSRKDTLYDWSRRVHDKIEDAGVGVEDIYNKSSKERYQLRKGLGEYIQGLDSLKAHDKAFWERAVIGRGDDFSQSGLVNMFDDYERAYSEFFAPLGFKLEDIHKLGMEADDLTFLYDRVRALNSRVGGMSQQTSPYINPQLGDLLGPKPTAALSTLEETKKELNEVVKKYKVQLNRFTDHINDVFVKGAPTRSQKFGQRGGSRKLRRPKINWASLDSPSYQTNLKERGFKLEQMGPQEYIKRISKEWSGVGSTADAFSPRQIRDTYNSPESKKKIAKYMEAMKRGDEFLNPSLDYFSDYAFMQDGLHRAIAAEKLGVKSMPVEVRYPKRRRVR